MNKKYDFLIFIGRFQPFHSGHLKVVEKAFEQSEKVIMLIGSAHQPRSVRNPWLFQERDEMIRNCIPTSQSQRLITAPLMDVTYNDELWVKNVQSTIHGLVTAHFATPHKHPRVGLIGHSKDHSSYYLNLFPQWGSVAVDDYKNINATPIRNHLLSVEAENHSDKIQQLHNEDQIPSGVSEYLSQFVISQHQDIFNQLCSEYQFIKKYKSGWEVQWLSMEDVAISSMAFDHKELIHLARERLANKVSYTDIGFHVLPKKFTLSQLQKAFEILMDHKLEKKSFRRRMMAADLVQETDEVSAERGRPAALYKAKSKQPYFFARSL